jgi:hypothetical protein
MEMALSIAVHRGEKECIQDFGGEARRKKITKKTYT